MKYIVLEGIDGVGKTTLAKELVKQFESEGKKAVFTFEPFGYQPGVSTEDNEALSLMHSLRTFALDKRYKELLTPYSRELLMLANRSIHHTYIKDHYGSFDVVISDRSFISGLVYKNMHESNIDDKTWWSIINNICKKPDLIVFVTSNNTQRIVDDQNHFYDSMGKLWYRELLKRFTEVLYLNDNNIEGIQVLRFENDFTIPLPFIVDNLFKSIKRELDEIISN